VHFGPVVAWEIALYSGASDVRQWLHEHYNDALAVEVEAAGVAQAGRRAGSGWSGPGWTRGAAGGSRLAWRLGEIS
jgi:nucleoside phosphorylase